jgi:NhaA family Na+:H+ antiporter
MKRKNVISALKTSSAVHVKSFINSGATGGLLLMGAALVALIIANIPFTAYYYDFLLNAKLEVILGEGTPFSLSKPLLLWINDGLMTLFFLVIGLEVKREILEGELSSFSKAALPSFAAIGGMVVPALLYVVINWGDSVALEGWAIPTATDIAFALGVMALLGKRVPASLKLFLLALAIIDDIAAIAIIAVFYSGDLSVLALGLSGVALLILVVMNRLRVKNLIAYLIVGNILWFLVLKSGVHATLAGVVLAFTIPRHIGNDDPLLSLEHHLQPWVNYVVMPLFAFANAGLNLSGFSLDVLFSSIPLGIMVGLVLGKPLGVFSFTWLSVKLGVAHLPTGVTWGQIGGVAFLCGIGFTISLFISGLAFQHGATDNIAADRLGIFVGSLLAGAIGYFVLRSQTTEPA